MPLLMTGKSFIGLAACELCLFLVLNSYCLLFLHLTINTAHLFPVLAFNFYLMDMILS